MLEKEGYPFKSKFHSRAALEYQTGKKDNVLCTQYRTRTSIWESRKCPKKLLYQFEDDWHDVKISDKCCDRLKKHPLDSYKKESGRSIAIIGIMPDEGGRREKAKCTVFSNDKLKPFQPLVPVTKEWEDWFINEYDIDISDIYKPPYSLHRTGCKGCPFALNLQDELDMLKHFFPNEYKQCEAIWKPVYDEYRRIRYRLRKDDGQMRLTDMFNLNE
jgi:3'-phosphoadenosine 5'-phosphosulfate sulfotransferase (PAPS reductase)/FAD synthetase